MVTYEKIEGNFKIKDGKFLIGKKELEDTDVVHMPIKMLKKIIKDSVEDSKAMPVSTPEVR